jgi:hypothetical protein
MPQIIVSAIAGGFCLGIAFAASVTEGLYSSIEGLYSAAAISVVMAAINFGVMALRIRRFYANHSH